MAEENKPDQQFQYIKLPDGSYGKFAANASDADIQGAISKDFPDAFKKSEPSVLEDVKHGDFGAIGNKMKRDVPELVRAMNPFGAPDSQVSPEQLKARSAISSTMRGFGEGAALPYAMEAVGLTAPEEQLVLGRMGKDTKSALKEGRALKVPLRMKSPVEAEEPQAAALERGTTSGNQADVLGRIGEQGNTIRARMADLGSPVTKAKALESVPVNTPLQAEELQYRPLPAGEHQALREFKASDPSALSKIGLPKTRMSPFGGAEEETPRVNYYPEPRNLFPGENEGYMASVPRDELSPLARMRKPGAGTQLQQLGKPVIYIPAGSDLP